MEIWKLDLKIILKENSKYVQNDCSLFTVPDYGISGGN